MFEIAGRNCRDLLDADGDATVRILEDSDGGVQLVGARCEPVADDAQWLSLLEVAAARRATEGTGVHAQSSRSHAVYRIFLDGLGERRSLTCVDLAGSEWSKDSELHDSARMKECIEINRSLMVLKQCIRLRREKREGQSQDEDSDATMGHLPFRESLITRLLKDAFTLPASQSRTIVVATVSPSSGDTEHSLSTLEHASLMDDSATCLRSETVELGRIQASVAPETAAQQAKDMTKQQQAKASKKRQALSHTWTMATTAQERSSLSYDDMRQFCADAGLVGSVTTLSDEDLNQICASIQSELPESERTLLQFVEFESFVELLSQRSGVMVSKLLKPLQAISLSRMQDGDYKDWCATQCL